MVTSRKTKKIKPTLTKRATSRKRTTATKKKTTKKASILHNDIKTTNKPASPAAKTQNDVEDFSSDDEMWDIYEQNRVESDASWNENYRRLQEFHSTHGHSGVPINWSRDSKFADWVSRQRQLFREINCGYRIASPREEGRWKRLQVLSFPLSYEKWYRLTRHRYLTKK